MKTIIINLLLTISLIAQVSIDSSKSFKQDNTTRLYGYATFVNVPSADDYNVGFLFGESYSDINFIPMGDYSWNNTTKQLTFWTDVTNLAVSSKHYFHAYIQPKASISKFEVEGEGWLTDIVCEPVISSASGTLTGAVGETLTFTLTMEERDETCSYNFQWAYTLASDSLDADSNTVYYYPNDWSNIGTNQNSWTTPSLILAYDRAKVRCIVSNSSGEDSIQGTIRVTE